jgi:histidinol phosphatase-like enzyme
MLLQAARDWGIDLERSCTIGDMPKDVLAGQRAGGKGILVGTASGVDGVLEGLSPDFVAEDVLMAVRWVLGQSGRMP